MKIKQIITVIVLGAWAAYLEFPMSYKGNMGYSSLIEFCLLMPLLVLAGRYLYLGFQECKKFSLKSHFVPFILSAIFIAIICSHLLYRRVLNNSSSAFTATLSQKVYGIEHTILNFKTSGRLRVQASNKFDDDYFWGTYTRKKDTVFLHVYADFNLGDTALIAGDTLIFGGPIT